MQFRLIMNHILSKMHFVAAAAAGSLGVQNGHTHRRREKKYHRRIAFMCYVYFLMDDTKRVWLREAHTAISHFVQTDEPKFILICRQLTEATEDTQQFVNLKWITFQDTLLLFCTIQTTTKKKGTKHIPQSHPVTMNLVVILVFCDATVVLLRNFRIVIFHTHTHTYK